MVRDRTGLAAGGCGRQTLGLCVGYASAPREATFEGTTAGRGAGKGDNTIFAYSRLSLALLRILHHIGTTHFISLPTLFTALPFTRCPQSSASLVRTQIGWSAAEPFISLATESTQILGDLAGCDQRKCRAAEPLTCSPIARAPPVAAPAFTATAVVDGDLKTVSLADYKGK